MGTPALLAHARADDAELWKTAGVFGLQARTLHEMKVWQWVVLLVNIGQSNSPKSWVGLQGVGMRFLEPLVRCVEVWALSVAESLATATTSDLPNRIPAAKRPAVCVFVFVGAHVVCVWGGF